MCECINITINIKWCYIIASTSKYWSIYAIHSKCKELQKHGYFAGETYDIPYFGIWKYMAVKIKLFFFFLILSGAMKGVSETLVAQLAVVGISLSTCRLFPIQSTSVWSALTLRSMWNCSVLSMHSKWSKNWKELSVEQHFTWTHPCDVVEVLGSASGSILETSIGKVCFLLFFTC